MELVIRELQDSDDVEKLTELIHRGYAAHAASGLKYWATHQTVEDTKKRIAMGICLVALVDGEYVGTGLFRRPQPESPVELYRDPTVWTLAQFCIAPEYKGHGVGKAIHAQGVQRLKEMGVATIALDTAEPAKPLIEMYKSWGYKLVGTCDWRPFTNYPSVVMAMAVSISAVKLASPDDRFGELFIAVQTSGMFSDSKTFVDAIPLSSDEEIMERYQQQKHQPGFRLKDFVTDNFAIPLDSPTHFTTDFSSGDSAKNAVEHMNILWDVLTRQPGAIADSGTLIPLPKPYVVPGGRFREIYYWDSYFTMLGLQASERWDLVENMVDNFSYLIDTLGFVPNGNRSYYLTRSQPPFYSLMVKLLEQHRGKDVLKKYLSQLQWEYDFWMEGAQLLTPEKPARKRVVLLPDGSIMNRYWDERATPRPESYIEDIELVKAHRLPVERYRDIRAAAESGWDFSGRWFKDHGNMSSIHTTEIIPIDLNALLYHHELVLAEAYQQSGDTVLQQHYLILAEKRKQALQRYMWNEQDGFFHDYDFVSHKHTNNKSLAAMFPLFFNMAEQQQAERVAQTIERNFLKPGGVTTTLNSTHQQWDAPNGWAPLHWITIKGLQNYQQNRLAEVIQERWAGVNLRVYKNTGKMMEKYNVYDLELDAGGGEYPLQDGFGWTNGVLLKLLDK